MSQIELIGDAYRVPVTNLGLYSDNTPMVKMEPFDAYDVDTMVVRPNSLSAFVTAMFLADSIEEQGCRIKNLILPYFPGARQDRINPTGDILNTAVSVARMINQRAFYNVVVLDPHSPVVMYNTRNATEYPLSEIAERMWSGYTGIISPDGGSRVRAEHFAKTMGLELYFGSKVRDVSTGKLSGFEVEKLEKGGHYLVVDDICDGGGTFIGLAEKIKEQGAFADLYVSHGIFSKGTDELKRHYKNIYTTDSMEKTAGTLTIPVVERMIDYV